MQRGWRAVDADPAFALGGLMAPCDVRGSPRSEVCRLDSSSQPFVVCGLPGPETNIPFLVSVRFPYGALGRVSRVSEKWLILAEREGFEPSKGF